MIECNPVPVLQKYGTSATYIDPIDAECIRAGVVPLDSLPASWWNWLWNESTGALIEANRALTSVICELDNVICAAGITPREACMNQLQGAINCLRQTLATAQTAGSVVSSSDNGKVSVGTDGTMTANGLGNVTNLTTSAKTNVVAAINELKSTYDDCTSTLDSCITTLDNTKAPNNHASTATTYGLGNASNYGHLKLSDTYDSEVEGDGIAASQKALYCVYAAMSAAGVQLGNTVGCALGTASAGSADTAARSDHVHPVPTLVCCASSNGSGTAFGTAATCGVTTTIAASCTALITSGAIAAAGYTTCTGTVTGTRACLVSANGYYGLRLADGTDNWIRTPTNGFIPVQSGGAGSGHSCLGTSSWYFASAYIDHVYSSCFHGNATCANTAGYAICHWCDTLSVCQRCTGGSGGCYCMDICLCFPRAGAWMVLNEPEYRYCGPSCTCACQLSLRNAQGLNMMAKITIYQAGWQKVSWVCTKCPTNMCGCTKIAMAQFY